MINPIADIRAYKISRQQRKFLPVREELKDRPPEIAAYQLRLFNAEWLEYCSRIPYYRDLLNRNLVPRQFGTWDEYVEKVSVCTRSLAKTELRERTDTIRKPDFFRTTGGTTSEPIRLPAWAHEERQATLDIWYARRQYGIRPEDRLFLIWGHSHLLGIGLRGRLNGILRRWKDASLGYYRFSAYDLRVPCLLQAGTEMLRHRPKYIIGYSVALDMFARVNRDRRNELRSLGVKAVIGAAEAFPSSDSIEILQDLFGCPVGMEYGSVETRLIAHTVPEGGYSVFWNSYFVEASRVSAVRDAYTLRVTSLYPRAFPLIRYELGDEIGFSDGRLGPSNILNVTKFRLVTGRCNESIILSDGSVAHSEVFTHLLRDHGDVVLAFQVLVDPNGSAGVAYLATRSLSSTELSVIRERCRRINPILEKMHFKHVPELQRTRAGKSPMIVRVARLPKMTSE